MEDNFCKKNDLYGFARTPERSHSVHYGRFRNVYLYITQKCQLCCKHCYLGKRLEDTRHMPIETVVSQLKMWRTMGGQKLSLLGGEPTLHPEFLNICRSAREIGYEQLIVNTNGLMQCSKQFAAMRAEDVSYVQVSLDGGSSVTHDLIRGAGTFDITWKTVCSLVDRGFDVRVICTVNKKNKEDCVNLIAKCDSIGVRLVKFHVFSDIGNGAQCSDWVISPEEWITFYESLDSHAAHKKIQVWYQPTYANQRNIEKFFTEGYRGCIGRTLDRISVFPNGRAYVCSYLFDTDMNMFSIQDGKIMLNKNTNEFDLFTAALSRKECLGCAARSVCVGGCPGEEVVMQKPVCSRSEGIFPICRLWKSACSNV